MTWDDVEDILYDGDISKIKVVRCPDCGGHLNFSYSEGENENCFKLTCINCGHISLGHNGPKPNCVKLFGENSTI
jgi:ssDNA-binding Zn-finger/Zn-ribbon topoisomerase 1